MRSERSSLVDLAVANLRRYFPNSRYVLHELPRKLKPPVLANVVGRCTVKACVWPATSDGRCRLHLMDAAALASTLPSALGGIIAPLHGHGYQPAASR